MSFGVTFNGKHSERDLGLKMISYSLPKPKAKTASIDIPYASGKIDLTEAGGDLFYEDRESVKFEFLIYDGRYAAHEAKIADLALLLQGQKVKVILDCDKSYYYLCRLHINTTKSNTVLSKIVLEGTAEPFKYELSASDEGWIWDTFNFETGIIRNLADITVSGSKEVEITKCGINSVPEFTVTTSNNLVLKYGGVTYSMPSAGKYRFPQIRIGKEAAKLKFEGSGKLSIKYRGRLL